MLLFFIRYQLAQGNSLPVKAAGISSSGIGISNCQNIDWFKMFRQFKLPAQNVRIKIAYPNASQAQFRGLQHHMVCQNRGVNVAGLFFVKGTNPCLLMVCADNDGQGSAVDVSSLSDFCKALLTLGDNQTDRLQIGSSGGNTGGFQNFLQLFWFYIKFLSDFYYGIKSTIDFTTIDFILSSVI